MYARVATYEVASERIGEAIESFREAGRTLQDLEGLERGFVLISEEGKLMTVTLWRTLTALETSETRAGLMRRSAASAVDGEVKSVENFEVAAELVPTSPLSG